jgi:predicted ArsR family transcriptional regulator
MAVEVKQLAGLSEGDLVILEGLSSAGAATPIDLAVRLRLRTEEVEPHLQVLRSRGLVDVKNRKFGFEREIYQVSASLKSLVTW